MKKLIATLIVIAAVVGIGWYAYRNYRHNQETLHPKFYSGNGRLEATEIYVSAQPAPSGFEADSVVCSATNRNNGRTAWDGKDEIIGRRNCQNIGTAA